MTLNKIAEQSYRDAVRRQRNGGNVDTNTVSMLKHTATEVIEATEAYAYWLNASGTLKEEASKGIFAGELADIICCVAIIAGSNNIDLNKAVADCLEKNQKRAKGTGD